MDHVAISVSMNTTNFQNALILVIALILMTALIVAALQTTQLMTLMFVLKKVESVLVRSTMKTGYVIIVTIHTMIILIVLIVNASQTTQKTNLMFVLRKVDSVLVR